MTSVVNMHQAKTHLSQLVERARKGEDIILAKAGNPCAKLVALEQPPTRRKPGVLKGKLSDAFFKPLPEEELAAWEK
jgi:prevent-host-death family protein